MIAGFFTAFQIATACAEGLCNGFGTVPSAATLIGSISTQLRSSYVTTLISNWKVWVLPQLINFAFIPPFARVAFANAVAVCAEVEPQASAPRGASVPPRTPCLDL